MNSIKKYLYILVTLLVAFVFFPESSPRPLDIKQLHPLYVADVSNDVILVGASHNIFVGKVIRNIGDKERGIGPETQFEVEVIENIKGELQDSVIVNQEGGFKDGVLYVIEDESASPVKQASDYLLQPGATYLFATRYNKKENWHTLISYPTAKKLLSSDSNLDKEQLKMIAQSDSRVNELKAAYPNEISLDADVKNNNALNSFSTRKTEPETSTDPESKNPNF